MNDVDAILKQMGKRGKLLGLLTDDDIDELLKYPPEIKVSENFKRRALNAMRKAQLARNKNTD